MDKRSFLKYKRTAEWIRCARRLLKHEYLYGNEGFSLFSVNGGKQFNRSQFKKNIEWNLQRLRDLQTPHYQEKT